MPTYVDAIIADTLGLSREDFGSYQLLIYATWRRNAQPFALDDDDTVRRVCRCSVEEWQKTRGLLLGFFETSGGFWRQLKLEKVWADVQRRMTANRTNGALGGRPKTQEKPMGSNWVNPDETQHQTIHEPDPSNDSPSLRSGECPRDEIRLAFEAWCAMALEAGLPISRNLAPGMRRRIGARMKAHGGLPAWMEALAKAKASSFCCGGGSKGWRLDLQAMTQEQTFVRLLEGYYDDRKPTGSEQPRSTGRQSAAFDAAARVAAKLGSGGRDGGAGPGAPANFDPGRSIDLEPAGDLFALPVAAGSSPGRS